LSSRGATICSISILILAKTISLHICLTVPWWWQMQCYCASAY
jgi:hypothetical protein